MLLNAVYDAYDLKDNKVVKITPTTEILIGVLISEQNKRDRIERWNRKQKEKD